MQTIMKEKFITAHMEVAQVYAKLSYCVRRKVGCVIVDQDRIVSIGFNGTPPGFENVCEIDGKTRSEVIHAEDNALKKLNYSAEGMCLFVTTAPCIHCAKIIVNSNVSVVYYDDEYNNIDGLNYLRNKNITVCKV